MALGETLHVMALLCDRIHPLELFMVCSSGGTMCVKFYLMALLCDKFHLMALLCDKFRLMALFCDKLHPRGSFAKNFSRGTVCDKLHLLGYL